MRGQAEVPAAKLETTRSHRTGRPAEDPEGPQRADRNHSLCRNSRAYPVIRRPLEIGVPMVLLNLGCGSRVHSDWVNIDYFPTAMFRRFFSRSSLPVNFVNHDLRKGIPIGDSSADA